MKAILFFLFSLPLLAGVNLSEIKGLDLVTGEKKTIILERPTVFLFLSSKCPCSKGHIQHLNELQKQFPQFDFIGFNSNQDEKLERSLKYFSNSEVNFPVLRDEKAKIADLLGALKTPHVFVIDSQKDILFEGGVTSSRTFSRAKHHYLEEALTFIAKGNPPPKEHVRTLGCYISRNE